jgi:hypothetical protein
MSASDRDAFRRALDRQKRTPRKAAAEPDAAPAEQPKSAPLVTQGGRSSGMPLRRRATPDDLIRGFRSTRSSGPGGWERIA